jgi:nicotinamide-nucleotide amidase
MSLRAGILVTGTEVLTGRVSDRNGPWLAERLRELGVDIAFNTIVGDRRADMRAALEFLAAQQLDLILTSGGLGPTADDLTTEVVAGFQEREMVLDEALEQRIAEILRPLAKRFPNIDMEAVRKGNRKQAMIPRGAAVLGPVGTAPGLVVPPGPERDGAPTIVVLPGPPRELQPMWSEALQTRELREALRGAGELEQRTMRLFGIPESEIAETLRVAEKDGVELEQLEITTCLKRGEVEVVTRYEPGAEGAYEDLVLIVRERHPETLFSTDGSTVDEQVAALLRGHGVSGAPAPTAGARTIATAESCTGGLLAARLTDLAGSSDYMMGGIVAYSDRAKVELAGVAAELIERHGAVSAEVARALAEGACERLHADVGVGITGVAGPGGGTEEKPVGLVWLSVALAGGGQPAAASGGHPAAAPGEPLTRSVHLPGGRADVRERASTVAMHLLRRALSAG